MKKAILLVLVLIACLTLVACGKDGYGKYSDLIQYIEDGDRQGAHQELDRLLPDEESDNQNDNQSSGSSGNNNSSGNDGSSDSSGNSGSSNQDQPDYSGTLQILCGEWHPNQEMNEAYRSAAVFEQDYTCTIAGESLTWKFVEQIEDKSKNTTVTVIDISNETRLRFRCQLYQKDGAYRMDLGVWKEGESYPYTHFRDYFLRGADYQVVTLTMDNWSSYFEDFYEICFNKNAFGEVESANILQWLLSKKEYQINGDLSSVAVAYEYDNRIYQKYTADPGTGEFALGEIVQVDGSYSYKINTTDTMRTVETNTDKTGRYGLYYLHGSCVLNKFPAGQTDRSGNYTITRIEGTIYIKK